MKKKPIPQEPMRLFVAIQLSDPMKEETLRIAEEWFPACPRAHWTRPDNLHLTLRFLGSCDPSKVDKITSAMAWAAALADPFSLRLSRPGWFSKGSEYILWLGVSGDTDPLRQLRSDLDTALKGAGFAPEKEPFRPHITVARAVKDVDPAELCASAAPKPLGVRVPELVLMHSTRINDELTYVPIARAPIGG